MQGWTCTRGLSLLPSNMRNPEEIAGTTQKCYVKLCLRNTQKKQAHRGRSQINTWQGLGMDSRHRVSVKRDGVMICVSREWCGCSPRSLLVITVRRWGGVLESCSPRFSHPSNSRLAAKPLETEMNALPQASLETGYIETGVHSCFSISVYINCAH